MLAVRNLRERPGWSAPSIPHLTLAAVQLAVGVGHAAEEVGARGSRECAIIGALRRGGGGSPKVITEIFNADCC